MLLLEEKDHTQAANLGVVAIEFPGPGGIRVRLDSPGKTGATMLACFISYLVVYY